MGALRSIALAALTSFALAALPAGALAATPAQAAQTSARLAYETGTATGLPWVWAAGAKGNNRRRLAQGDGPALSPNGQLVALTSVGPNGQAVLVYSVGGTFLARYPGAHGPLSFSPDSTYLVMDKSGLQVADLKAGSLKLISRGNLQGASFAPGRDRLVYGLSKSQRLNSPVNLYTVGANGANRKQLTRDGRSANPVWGRRGIAFDRVTLRGNGGLIYQIYVLSGGRVRQITNLKVPALLFGLVPLAVAADGVHLVASYQGEDTDQAWTVNLKTGGLKQLKAGTRYVSPWGISRSGKRVLVGLGGFESAASTGDVATIPFGGGRATVLVKHAGIPSWNQ